MDYRVYQQVLKSESTRSRINLQLEIKEASQEGGIAPTGGDFRCILRLRRLQLGKSYIHVCDVRGL